MHSNSMPSNTCLEQAIAGEDLLELARSHYTTVEQLRECGLKTVSQQLKLRRLLSQHDALPAAASPDTSLSTSVSAAGTGSRPDIQINAGTGSVDKKS